MFISNDYYEDIPIKFPPYKKIIMYVKYKGNMLQTLMLLDRENMLYGNTWYLAANCLASCRCFRS